MSNIEYITEEMIKKAYHVHVDITENHSKIIRAKNMMFSKDEWQKCPCDSENSERFCISDLCLNDIKTKGICHCKCYKKKGE